MTNDSQERLWPLVNEFMKRMQADEEPTIEEFCDRYPEMASEIRELFPTILAVDEFRDGADQAEPQEAPPVELPDRIAGFRIKREIGRGGMGIVYEAEQIALGRAVALKTLPARSSADSRALARFEREGRAIAKLHHTNIVPLFEVGNDGGVAYLAMQLIQGESLDRVIVNLSSGSGLQNRSGRSSSPETDRAGSSNVRANENQLSNASSGSERRRLDHYRSVARIGMQAANALDYAHTRDVIHRDVKPSNLILDESGVVWLTDFGLAKLQDDDLTQTGDFLGTLRYMAPERLTGQCDERSDVYGLGLTLYELLTQQTAFTSSDRPKLVSEIVNVEPARPRSIDHRIPRDLETIVLHAIDKDPRSRYPTAIELADDLQRFLRDEPIQARRSFLPERMMRWSKRNRALAGALFGIMALTLLLAAVSTFAWVRQSELTQVAVSRSDQLQRNLYFSEMNLAGQSALARFGVATVRRKLERWTPDRVGSDLRGWEWYYLHSVSNQGRLATPANDTWTWSADFSPDASEFVHCVNGWGIYVRDAKTGDVVREKLLGSARFVDWSPNGKRIAVAGFDNNVNLCDAQTLEVIRKIGGQQSVEVTQVRWSPDGSRIATTVNNEGSTEHTVRIWSSDDGELLASLTGGHSSNISCVSWSPDGMRIASTGNDGTRIWDIASEKPLHQVASAASISSAARAVCWSPDGKWVAVGSDKIETFDLASGESQKSVQGNGRLAIRSIQWRPGKHQVACGQGDGTVTLWDLDQGLKLRTFRGHSGEVWDLRWNADGSQLVTNGMDNSVRIWDVDNLDQTQEMPIHAAKIAWSPDGQWIFASGQWWSKVTGWNPATNQQEVLFDQAKEVAAITASDDGDDVVFAGRSGLSSWDRKKKTIKKHNANYWYSAVDCNPVSNVIAVADKFQNLLVITDPETGTNREIRTANGINDIEWHGDGKRLAIAGREGVVEVIDASGDALWQQTRESGINAIRWSPDGSQLASAENGAIVIWNAETGELIRELDALDETFVSIDWSPDSERIVTGSSSSVAIWDPESGHVALKLPGGGSNCVRWNSDGRRIAAGREWDGISIWDAGLGYDAASRGTGESSVVNKH